MCENLKSIALAIDENFSELFSIFSPQPFRIGDFLYFTALNFFTRQQVEFLKLCFVK